jgi:hypothetical protein
MHIFVEKKIIIYIFFLCLRLKMLPVNNKTILNMMTLLY